MSVELRLLIVDGYHPDTNNGFSHTLRGNP